MMTPKTSSSQVGTDVCCGWGNCYIWRETNEFFPSFKTGLTIVKQNDNLLLNIS
jgi:hypothetical protein